LARTYASNASMTNRRAERAGIDALEARTLAAAVLQRIERDRAYADVALDAVLRTSRLDTRDRALATRLVYGTLAWQGRLDWHLAALARREPAALDPPLRTVLRLGLYQILFLDRIPAHAAVATSVDLAKRLAPAGAGLVNAVLRRAVRERTALPLPDPVTAPVRHLAVAFSHPEWLVAHWRERFGDADLRALLAADNQAAPTVLRARRSGRDALIARLSAAGVGAEPCRFAPDAVRVSAAAPHALAGYAAGAFSVQSEASQLVVLLLDPQPGMRVLDACAAPGGKVTYIADLMGDRGLIVALDRRRRGAQVIARAARRLTLGAIATTVADARCASRVLRDVLFDRILVDAPCSGLGTLRAHPEVRWTRTPTDLVRLAALQRDILEGVTPLLRPGGVLVYATCTIGDEENEGVVRAWLAGHSDLATEDAAQHLPRPAAGLLDRWGALRTLPHRDGLDGFYAVRVRRLA
jgi:16S rRNA (cytosine967-C5)-methyltransferase